MPRGSAACALPDLHSQSLRGAIPLRCFAEGWAPAVHPAVGAGRRRLAQCDRELAGGKAVHAVALGSGLPQVRSLRDEEPKMAHREMPHPELSIEPILREITKLTEQLRAAELDESMDHQRLKALRMLEGVV